MTGQRPVLEICLDSVASAIAAEEGGADRVELCDNLIEGGTTPSEGTIRVARERIGITLHVIIRPRGGDFLYSDDEFAVMEADVRRARELGADGVVFGVLNRDGTVDRDRNARLRELAGPLNTTFHRAFDVTPDPFAALEEIRQLGIGRILTSGQAPNVWEGLDLIRALLGAAGEDLVIMPGAGLRPETIGAFREKSGAREFHMLIDREVPSRATFRREIPMGGGLLPPEYALRMTDAAGVRIGRAGLDG
jgi:copper homeostasis protein